MENVKRPESRGSLKHHRSKCFRDEKKKAGRPSNGLAIGGKTRAFPNNGAPGKVENFMARTCDGFEYDSKRTGKFFNQRAARTRELVGRNVLLSLFWDVPEFSFSAFDIWQINSK